MPDKIVRIGGASGFWGESAVAMPPANLSREAIEELRALGYIQ